MNNVGIKLFAFALVGSIGLFSLKANADSALATGSISVLVSQAAGEGIGIGPFGSAVGTASWESINSADTGLYLK